MMIDEARAYALTLVLQKLFQQLEKDGYLSKAAREALLDSSLDNLKPS